MIWVEGKSSPIARVNGSVEWNGYIEDVSEEVKRNEKIQLLTAVFQILGGKVNQVPVPFLKRYHMKFLG